MGWKDIKEDIAADRSTKITYFETNAPGIMTAELWHNVMPYPLGIVWYRYESDRISIMHSYTNENVRRLGVRTRIHQKMLKWYPKLYFYTESATKKSKPWLIKQGFKKKKTGWYLKRIKIKVNNRVGRKKQ